MNTFDDRRVQEILKGRRASRVLPFPGDDERTIGIRLLADQEIDNARLDALVHLSRHMPAIPEMSLERLCLVDPELLDREVQRQVIYKAFVNPDTIKNPEPEPFFADPDDVRGLDSVMVETLHQAYLNHQEYANPQSTLTDEQVDELVDTLGKEQSGPDILSLLDARSLRILVHSMAARLAKSPPGK